MTDRLLELRDVHVTLNARGGFLSGKRHSLEILRGITAEVRKGQAFGIVGESGAGKTTLFRVVTGLQAPTVGEVRFGGQVLGSRRTSAERRAIQMVFQDPYSSLNPRMTVRQTIGELLRVHDIVPTEGIDDELHRLMEIVGLSAGALDKRPRAFSGGQRQRLAIARALAVRPELLLADEPVSALDVSVQAGILRLLKDLQRNLGLTVVFVSHDLAVVRQFCDYAAVMKAGEVVEAGESGALFDSPQHPYTKQLVDSMPLVLPRRSAATAAPTPGTVSPGRL